jgi:hypothetical protein
MSDIYIIERDVSDLLYSIIRILNLFSFIFMCYYEKGDFPRKILDVETQVDLLIKQARSLENLCQSYLGWCPYW